LATKKKHPLFQVKNSGFEIDPENHGEFERGKNLLLRRNPARLDMANVPLFTRVFLSQLVQAFFHQL